MKKMKRVLILCLVSSSLCADPSTNDDATRHYQDGGNTVIEEENPYPTDGPYWVGPGMYEGVYFDYPEDYYGYYYQKHGYYDNDGNWHAHSDGSVEQDRGREGGFEETPHEESYHGGGGGHR